MSAPDAIPATPPAAALRPATLDDLDELLRLETVCFDTDRLSRRSFRRAITRTNTICLVHAAGSQIHGYALVLLHTGTSLARLYSIAVDPAWRGQRLGENLLIACETAAREAGCIAMRLEIRRDNSAGLQLYRRMGYRQFGVHTAYYEDHMDALRMEKSLVAGIKPALARVPYYEQTLDFTCGPAALIMAMQSLQPDLAADRKLELRLWRESTTIYMTSGHGGCGPYGLALSAFKRKLNVEIYVNDANTAASLFVDSVRSQEKKEVIRLVQEDFLAEIAQAGIPLHYRALGVEELQQQFEAGAIPVVLISSYRIYREKSPHWVVATGFDERFIYVHDPYVDYKKGKTRIDCINLPILKREFAGMARYGKTSLRAALLIKPQHQNQTL